MSYKTVTNACSQMRQKLGVRTLAELIHVAVTHAQRQARPGSTLSQNGRSCGTRAAEISSRVGWRSTVCPSAGPG